MTTSRWRADGRERNALYLQVEYREQLDVMAELDALGHRTLTRITGASKADSIEFLIGVALTRRVVTIFTGLRELIEASGVESAKLLARAQFEILLAARIIVHGARRHLAWETSSSRRGRESRARYYLAASKRRDIYRRQGLLDGVWGNLAPTAAERSEIRKEIEEEKFQLDRFFGTQQKAFGPLRCYPPKGRHPRYYDHAQWYSFAFRTRRVHSLRGLSVALGLLNEYEMVYDAFSGLTHPRGISHDLKVADGEVEVFSPHMTDAFDQVFFWGTGFQLVVLTYLTKGWVPEAIDDVRRVDLKVRAARRGLDSRVPEGYF